MSDVVDLRGQPAQLEDNQEFVADLCRFAENILSEAAVKKKYRFDNATWEKLGSNDALVEENRGRENYARIRDGSTKRETAQQLVVKAPDVVATSCSTTTRTRDTGSMPAKTLERFAANGPDKARRRRTGS